MYVFIVLIVFNVVFVFQYKYNCKTQWGPNNPGTVLVPTANSHNVTYTHYTAVSLG